jgi:predicted GIY-YIG superfamily endonuclease
VVYLIHFNEAFKHARHYLGYAEDLDARLERHRSGDGARLLAVLKSAGIAWRCVRTWQGDRKLERQLKNRHNAPKLCAICSGEQALKRARKENQ